MSNVLAVAVIRVRLGRQWWPPTCNPELRKRKQDPRAWISKLENPLLSERPASLRKWWKMTARPAPFFHKHASTHKHMHASTPHMHAYKRETLFVFLFQF